MKWYNSYTDFPYKHLGNDTETGIDCFNLCRLVYEKELNITIPYQQIIFVKLSMKTGIKKLKKDTLS